MYSRYKHISIWDGYYAIGILKWAEWANLHWYKNEVDQTAKVQFICLIAYYLVMFCDVMTSFLSSNFALTTRYIPKNFYSMNA